jgi:hypothetical protein
MQGGEAHQVKIVKLYSHRNFPGGFFVLVSLRVLAWLWKT